MKTLLETFFRIFTALKAHGTRSRSHGPHRQIPSSQRITNDGIHSSLHRRHGRLQRLCRLHHRRATDQRGALLHYVLHVFWIKLLRVKKDSNLARLRYKKGGCVGFLQTFHAYTKSPLFTQYTPYITRHRLHYIIVVRIIVHI